MVANNTTGDSAGSSGILTVSYFDFILITLAIFAGAWILLGIVMYFIAPFFAKFADQRSRVAYSAVYSLPFAIIFALGLGGTMSLISSANFIVSLVMALVIVFGLVMFQNYLLNTLIRKGIIKMETKNPPPRKGTVKGKRK